jgi:hypothetical protein
MTSRLPNPVEAQSKAWVCGCSLVGIAGSNPAEGMVSVCCECCVLSERCLCARLIIGPQESYRLRCVLSVTVKPR